MRKSLLLLLVLAGCSGTPSTPSLPAELSFDRLAERSGWRSGATGGTGPVAGWERRREGAGNSVRDVVALTEIRHQDQDRFNLHWCDRLRLRDGELEVDVRADDGTIDQGGGPIWRAQDENNYYICRFNPLEANFRLYVVQDGRRRQLASVLVPGSHSGWHRIRVVHRGNHIECTLDDVQRLEATDASLSDEGAVGLWTKADARTSFTNLRVAPAP